MRVLRRDVVLGSFFALAWVLPVAHTAARGYPSSSLPVNLRDLYSISCLFRHRTTAPVVFYVQVRFADRRGYYDIDEREYFSMQPFGHRNRFDRFMARFAFREDADTARQELVDWLAKRHGELHPDEAPVVAVRFLWGAVEIEDAFPPQGHWQKPALADMRQHVSQMGVYEVGGTP
jgi:hypothetical protein